VTGTATYLVQERAMEELRMDYQTLEERHSKVGAELQDAMALIKVRDGQITALTRDAADVHRLRADVDRLNRETEQLEQVREENRRLSGDLQRYQATLEKASNDQRQARREAEVRQEQVFIGRLQAMKLVGGAQLQHASESDGWFPQDYAAASLYLKSPPDDIELLFTGH
jgi:DNA repair exonuclease SbcCD ATPase subunit